ncbi:MAG: 3-methylcrotonyl-CoA carboxylase alpha subunit [Hyphomicrobiaceae bacterium]|jgi:3-methylcrotonyl-CoA carboxylase alpha subunit
MFKKILIANRGEIACRVMRTAKQMGIATVAIYSDADAGAMHVAMADEAYHVGPPAASASYLNVERIIEVAKLSGAEAVHPGYGFLSENAEFVEAVTAAGMRFIGPSAASIRAMGLKDAAKALMEQANVPIVPGYHGENQDAEFLAGEAGKIGYPVLIKARAGGGGKGMRRVDDPADFKAALEGAQREGKASFGDAAVLIEKYLIKPRHIEVQVFGDDHGNVVHLFERDCSLQRRHQKVIEEAPATDMSDEMRAAMGQAAVTAAEAINYSGAGTIEFIADVSDGLRNDRFYFMEMNTRLQVEHPVTELITGHDLVEWQLRVANGEPLPASQFDLTINGWAIEARLYAENAAKGFLPATGTLKTLSFPDPNDGVRIDTGVREGDTITPFYDPMIAKIIVHGETREAALNKLAAAMRDCHVAGTVTNARFLLELVRNPGFASGDVDTGLIERDFDALIATADVTDEAVALAALAALKWPGAGTANDPWLGLGGWRLWGKPEAFIALQQAETAIDAVVTFEPGGNAYTVAWDDKQVSLTIDSRNGEVVRASSNNRTFTARATHHGDVISIFMDGEQHAVTVPDPLAGSADEAADADRILAPMPGLIKIINVAAGDTVSKGDPVMVMEAMKMEYTLSAPRDGTIGELQAGTGDQVEEGAVLLEMAEA